MQTRNVLTVMLGAAALLLIPLVAMQFTSEVNWTGSDFATAWVLLTAIDFGLTMALKKTSSTTIRVTGTVIVLALVWLWAELSVGIFTNLGS